MSTKRSNRTKRQEVAKAKKLAGGGTWLPLKEYKRLKRQGKNVGQKGVKPKKVRRIAKQKANVKKNTEGFSTANMTTAIKPKSEVDPELQDGLQITVMPDSSAFWWWILPTASYLLEKGILTSLIQLTDLSSSPGQSLLNGLAFMQAQMAAVAQGQNPQFKTIPKYMNILSEALKPKQVKFITSRVSYQYGTGDYTSGFSDTNNINGHVWMFGDPIDNGSYESIVNPVSGPSPDVSSWNALLESFHSVNLPLTVLCPEKQSELTTNDASAFARSYVYNGIGNGPAGGWYGDVESEAQFKMPMFGRFAIYNNNQLRVSRYLYPSSGDSSTLMGLPLTSSFEYSHFSTKFPPIYKCIDFEEIYGLISSWAVAVLNQFAISDLNPIETPGLADFRTSLPFSTQDFRIMLRQALMAFFSESQRAVQFLQPMEFTVSTSNGFQPFFSSTGTFGLSKFGQILLPQVLVENLKCLKMRAYKPKQGNERNVLYYIPVLGRYVKDNVVPYFFTTGADVIVPLYQDAVQTAFDLIDGSGPPNVFRNFNAAYYQNVLQNWNVFVTELQQYSVPIGPLNGDAGPPGLNLLSMTRYQNFITGDSIQAFGGRGRRLQRYEMMAKETIQLRIKPVLKDVEKSKSPVRKIMKQATEGKVLRRNFHVGNLPAADLTNLGSVMITTNTAFSPEISGMFNFFILPVIRADPNNPIDPTNETMFQTESFEPKILMQSAVQADFVFNGVSRYIDLSAAGSSFGSGLAAGKNPVIANIMSVLTEKGEAGFFGDIAAGLVGSFVPGMGPIADSLAKYCPL